MLRRVLLFVSMAAASIGAVIAASEPVVLPSGWRLTPSGGPAISVGTMPQGAALSPDGSLLAIVESGVNPAALRVVETHSLTERALIPLKGAFGRPVWRDNTHVAIAGANADALLDVDLQSKNVSETALGKNSWPAAIAINGSAIAAADDGAASVTIGAATVRVGDHPSALVFSRDGKTLYVAVRGTNAVVAIDTANNATGASIPVGLHPSALALSEDGARLYVAESDDDSIGVIDTRSNTVLSHIPVGLHAGRASGYGASPNALLVHGDDLFVSLGAENAIALVRNGSVAARIPVGWYPSDVALGTDGTLYAINGKGEGSPANPQFNPRVRRSPGYVASITVGSVRAIPPAEWTHAANSAVADNVAQWTPPPAAQTVIRPHGPIQHVIYVIKENRSYDQVLGDVPGADGDPKLAWFNATVTPNQHAAARRFGIFDNAYADAQVSANGHNWTDAGFANDYVERFWPVNYGGRRELYDFQTGGSPAVPHNGYLWDAAKRSGVTYRDYGEDVDEAPNAPIRMSINSLPGLTGHFDPRYIGWDLKYSDLDRFAEWQREFHEFVANGKLPQLEIVYLPNDHTAGTAPGAFTPEAYVATNDWAVGRLIQEVSHSPYWKSTAIFVLEDDAQNGPDHVSAQRSTFYVASPYAMKGVHHAHYSTVSVVHTIELLLGLPPLSIYDATARPMYDAFGIKAVNSAAFTAVKPSVDMTARNTKAAYGAALSAKLDFSKPDEVDPRVLNDILAHAVRRP
jgi:YVTN family beta-propeller protein